MFLTAVWVVHVRPHPHGRIERFAYPVGTAAVLGAAWSPAPALTAGLLAAVLVIVVTLAGRAEGVRR
ncbi:hypothetical protein ABZ595_37180 [Streptomyces rubradiris]|uniref:hypothetical protein n=1 Tax=Streptomyces rubradiris TaxID=285531 RepID=UPI0033D732F9